MEQFKPSPRYHYCNYCDNFVPFTFGEVIGRGTCKHGQTCVGKDFFSSLPIIEALPPTFDSRGCVSDFKQTIHNHYGVDYPEYLEEYIRGVTFRYVLDIDTYVHSHS